MQIMPDPAAPVLRVFDILFFMKRGTSSIWCRITLAALREMAASESNVLSDHLARFTQHADAIFDMARAKYIAGQQQPLISQIDVAKDNSPRVRC